MSVRKSPWQRFCDVIDIDRGGGKYRERTRSDKWVAKLTLHPRRATCPRERAALLMRLLRGTHHWRGQLEKETLEWYIITDVWVHGKMGWCECLSTRIDAVVASLRFHALPRGNAQEMNSKISSIRTPVLMQGRLERTETNLIHFKWEVTWTPGNQPNTL